MVQYSEALEMILSAETPDDDDLEDERFLEIYQEATDLYGLIHARFILTSKGLMLMKEKYVQGKFGACPRVLCERQHVLPVGMSEELRTSRVKVYCPRCQDVYIPKKKCPDVDGAYFGCSFPSIFLVVRDYLLSILYLTVAKLQRHRHTPQQPVLRPQGLRLQSLPAEGIPLPAAETSH